MHSVYETGFFLKYDYENNLNDLKINLNILIGFTKLFTNQLLRISISKNSDSITILT